MKLTVSVDVPMTLEQLAGLFVELDADSQAKFFRDGRSPHAGLDTT